MKTIKKGDHNLHPLAMLLLAITPVLVVAALAIILAGIFG